MDPSGYCMSTMRDLVPTVLGPASSVRDLRCYADACLSVLMKTKDQDY
jgi:hypothetical protein